MTQAEYDIMVEREAEEHVQRCREYSRRKREALTSSDPASERGHRDLINSIIREVML